MDIDAAVESQEGFSEMMAYKLQVKQLVPHLVEQWEKFFSTMARLEPQPPIKIIKPVFSASLDLPLCQLMMQGPSFPASFRHCLHRCEMMRVLEPIVDYYLLLQETSHSLHRTTSQGPRINLSLEFVITQCTCSLVVKKQVFPTLK